ncbi:hypothetical protein D3C87_1915440 [compost metagenome]
MVQIGNYWNNFFKEVLLNAKIEGETNRATKQAAHDIALLFIRRYRTIDRQEGSGTKVIGNYAHTFSVTLIVLTAEAL